MADKYNIQTQICPQILSCNVQLYDLNSRLN